MDHLDEDQLAVYLHVTPAQVRKLADRGKLPGRKIGGAWRFSEAEIHTWLEQRIGASHREELNKMQQVVQRWSGTKEEGESNIAKLLLIDAIEIPLQARTQGSVVRRMCALAGKTGILWDTTKMQEAVTAREQLHPTALDIGVALLHPRRPQASILGGPLLALGISTQPIPFGNRSGHLTDVFFLICSTDDKVHLQVLAKLSRLLTEDEFLQKLRAAETTPEAHALVQEFEMQLDERE